MSILTQQEQLQIKAMHWPFFGCFMQQSPRAVVNLNRLLNVESFDTIIELGTHDGGLSTLFALYCWGANTPAASPNVEEPSLYKNQTHHKTPKRFFTYDNVVRDSARIHMLRTMGTTFDQLDFLDDSWAVAQIAAIIHTGKRVLLLCDGGCKVREFATYAPYLKRGDIIMAHDWSATEEDFKALRERGIWFGHELKWTDIEGLCKKHDIIQVFKEDFDDAVWFCGVKQ